MIDRGALPRLARLGSAARLEPHSRAKVFGFDPEATRIDWVRVLTQSTTGRVSAGTLSMNSPERVYGTCGSLDLTAADLFIADDLGPITNVRSGRPTVSGWSR